MKTAGESPAAAGRAAASEIRSPGGAPEAEGPGGPEADPFPFPTLLDCLSAVIRGARAPWSPRLLVPAWSVALVLWLGWEVALPRMTTSGGTGAAVLRAFAAAATVAIVWLASALVVLISAWDFGRDARLSVAQGLRAIRARSGAILASLLFVPGAALVLFALIAGGAAALGALPVVGGGLSMLWLALPGFPLALLLAGLLLLGVSALPLILSAAALEAPFPFDAVARGMSYVRGRPGRYFAALLCGLLAAVLETLVFACFTALTLTALLAAHRAGDIARSGIGALSGLGSDLLRAATFVDPCWPIWKCPPGPGDAAAVDLLIFGAAGRALTGFAAASALSALARTYLHLRWTLDGETPAALLRPDEEFEWNEGG